ncbi:MAG: hypothetical protein P4L56_00240 [Candidatus Sulfopaludibacter sp.]|nr:hypothetical protein [Candidatus Sulfopaludibacter sp.]
MLPWNYGFHLDAGHIVFLGAFYTVLVIVATTLVSAALRSRQDLRSRKLERIRWHSEFNDLPARDRACRHVLTGELESRECPHSFDCRECETHARLVEGHPVAAGEEEEIFGMSFPLDRLYHRGHTWVRPESDGTVTVGLDDLGSRLLGTPGQVALPPVGSQIEVNGTAFRVHKHGADVRVLSPVEGEVLEAGAPGAGWYLRVRPAASGEPAFRHLLRGAEVRPWLMRELERLQLTLTAEGAAPALADGGVPIADMSQAYPQADWDAVCGEMFLEG